MPAFHPALDEHSRRIIEQGLDVPHDADLVPLSCDVIDGDLAAALFAHGDALEWAVFEYDGGWSSLCRTAIIEAGSGPAEQQQERVGIEHNGWARSRTRRWSPRGRHLVHARVLRAHRIAQLRVATRTVATPRGWAIMVWRGRDAPAVSVDSP
ncbi:hypothetical protein [Nonomuraea rhizosphaerae]|uniref:hypothetical protein n=1 Tax=Nonomuraea rhizosphaerae TaxID=2665663 RepID=UPI001C5FB80D|nr:hypothetical protein [Nonomuraea rhizosphaerae]